MHFLQAINSDISVLIVCDKTGGTIKGDIKKTMTAQSRCDSIIHWIRRSLQCTYIWTALRRFSKILEIYRWLFYPLSSVPFSLYQHVRVCAGGRILWLQKGNNEFHNTTFSWTGGRRMVLKRNSALWKKFYSSPICLRFRLPRSVICTDV